MSFFITPAYAQNSSISIPSVGLQANIEEISLTDGEVGVPSDPNNAGEIRLPGNLLIDGHVDWAGTIRPFYYLKYVKENDKIYLSDGSIYHIVWISESSVDEDMSEAFYPSDMTYDQLTLITCVGPFSLSRHEYLDRLVIRAVRDA